MRDLTGGGAATVGVVGAGAMGTGIAQVAASRGHRVVLCDARPGAAEGAGKTIDTLLGALVSKGKLTESSRRETLSRIELGATPLGNDLSAYRECDIVIEAVVEDLEVKQTLFRNLASALPADVVLATNTSSLSVAAIASSCAHAERVLGVHFFNPPQVMPLVEIIPWLGSDDPVVESVDALVASWGKTTVRASDTPGFIVNRVARPFYGEALRQYDEGIADFATIDWAVRDLGGFRMGPFELMDFIGNDVNYAVTRSVFESFSFDPRYRPSLTQRRLVDAGFLGRKTKRGYYDYRDGAARPEPLKDEAHGRRILERILVMLINEAVDAVFWRVAKPRDLELAMTKGVNYPKGLLEWGNELGFGYVLDQLDRLRADYAEERYRPSPLLRRLARESAEGGSALV
jgi:3-hydroxybutyryl-CoA dehydrogenase